MRFWGEVEKAGDDDDDDDDGHKNEKEITPLKVSLTDKLVTPERDPCIEDVCAPYNLPGLQHVEDGSRILVDIGLQEDKLALTVLCSPD